MNIVATRLTPGTDLLEGIEKLVHEHDIRAGVVISAVASLQRLHLRMGGATPEQSEYIEREGFFEVVSVTGTVSTTGVHLHISVSTSDGSVIGGHLREGNIVRTTAEIAIANEPDLVFARGLDSRTGWEELEVFEVVTPSGAPEPVV